MKKVESDVQKVQKQTEAKRDGELNPQNYNSNEFFKHGEFFMFSGLYESTEVDRRTWLHLPSGTHWSTSSDTHQILEYKKRLQLRCIHHLNHIQSKIEKVPRGIQGES